MNKAIGKNTNLYYLYTWFISATEMTVAFATGYFLRSAYLGIIMALAVVLDNYLIDKDAYTRLTKFHDKCGQYFCINPSVMCLMTKGSNNSTHVYDKMHIATLTIMHLAMSLAIVENIIVALTMAFLLTATTSVDFISTRRHVESIIATSIPIMTMIENDAQSAQLMQNNHRLSELIILCKNIIRNALFGKTSTCMMANIMVTCVHNALKTILITKTGGSFMANMTRLAKIVDDSTTSDSIAYEAVCVVILLLFTLALDAIANYLQHKIQERMHSQLSRLFAERLFARQYAAPMARLRDGNNMEQIFSPDWNGGGGLEQISYLVDNKTTFVRNQVTTWTHVPEGIIIARMCELIVNICAGLPKEEISADSRKSAIACYVSSNYDKHVHTNTLQFPKSAHMFRRNATINRRGSRIQHMRNVLSIMKDCIIATSCIYKYAQKQITNSNIAQIVSCISTAEQVGYPHPILFGNLVLMYVLCDCASFLLPPDSTKITHGQNSIILTNYKLMQEDQQILSIDNLELTDRTVISGSSGAGKSTLFKDIMGVLPKVFTSSGTIHMPSTDGILVISQDTYSCHQATAFEHIYMDFNELLTASQLETVELHIRQYAAELGILSKIEDMHGTFDIYELSGGQRKKMDVLRALILKPRTLLCDELFTGLDEDSIFKIQTMLDKYLPNTTMIFIEHLPSSKNFNFFRQHIKISESGDSYTIQKF